MNYAEMSDFEINRAVAIKSNMNCIFPRSAPPVVGVLSGECYITYDPCNSWSDAGPIIQREFIAINPVMKGWCASSDDDAEMYFTHENPLRAAMIVFLKMQEGKWQR